MDETKEKEIRRKLDIAFVLEGLFFAGVGLAVVVLLVLTGCGGGVEGDEGKSNDLPIECPQQDCAK